MKFQGYLHKGAWQLVMGYVAVEFCRQGGTVGDYIVFQFTPEMNYMYMLGNGNQKMMKFSLSWVM